MKRNTTQSASSKDQRGYILLSVMLVMVLMLIALTVELPRISQQIKREKEEELVHRGREYAIAIKRFYHKNGTYPVSLDQLEGTNNIRFLRRRFKDPMTESGEFKLVHLGEAQINLPVTAAGSGTNLNQGGNLTTNSPTAAQGPGASGPNPTPSPTGLNSPTSGFGSSGFNTGSPGGLGSGGMGSSGLSNGNQGPGGLNSNPQAGNQPGTGQTGTTGQMGTLTTQNIGNGMIAQGGGAGPIIGVASTSKNTSIKEFNNNNEYDQWLFVYDLRAEQAGTGGVIIASPIGAAGTGPGSSGGIPQPIQPVRTPTSPQ